MSRKASISLEQSIVKYHNFKTNRNENKTLVKIDGKRQCNLSAQDPLHKIMEKLIHQNQNGSIKWRDALGVLCDQAYLGYGKIHIPQVGLLLFCGSTMFDNK